MRLPNFIPGIVMIFAALILCAMVTYLLADQDEYDEIVLKHLGEEDSHYARDVANEAGLTLPELDNLLVMTSGCVPPCPVGTIRCNDEFRGKYSGGEWTGYCTPQGTDCTACLM